MDHTTRYHWRISLELKLRRHSGDSFQDFFSTVMAKVHGNDFIRVRAYGSRGDKGCDGYIQSSGKLFQCYGAVNGAKDKVDYLTKKMVADFNTAREKLSPVMKEWHMVHNIVDGLPIEAIETLDALKQSNPSIEFGFIGLEGIENQIFALPITEIEDLLGPAATAEDEKKLQTSELRDLVHALEIAADLPDRHSNIKPVPADKLEFNNLPNHWHRLISSGWHNAHLVSQYFGTHHDPLMGEHIAKAFNEKYLYLKSQRLAPGAIMSCLYEFINGKMSSPARQVATQALLAHLFESCDIFEDAAGKVR